MTTLTLSTGRVVILHRPKIGSLRGVNLKAIENFDIDALAVLAERVTDLTPAEFYDLDISDALTVVEAMAGFLTPRPSSPSATA